MSWNLISPNRICAKINLVKFSRNTAHLGLAKFFPNKNFPLYGNSATNINLSGQVFVKIFIVMYSTSHSPLSLSPRRLKSRGLSGRQRRGAEGREAVTGSRTPPSAPNSVPAQMTCTSESCRALGTSSFSTLY